MNTLNEYNILEEKENGDIYFDTYDGKKAGILMPIASLPSNYGIGDFGPKTYEFADLLKDASVNLWQILPLNPLGYGYSPYQPLSSFAIDPIYISLDVLYENKLLNKIPSDFNKNEKNIKYNEVRTFKNKYFLEAYNTFIDKEDSINTLLDFLFKNQWVYDWAVYIYRKQKNNNKAWNEWKGKDRDFSSFFYEKLGDNQRDFLYNVFLQFVADKQWLNLKKHLNNNGISVVGDLPFYVGYDSSDVYANKRYFELYKTTLKPKFIAGVPPDYFSKTGQRWGNPLYKWDELKKDNYSFSFDRIGRARELYDVIRLDHFRAFDTYWKINAKEKTAINGEWVLGPSYDFFDKLFNKYPDINFIAEDLGELRPEVLKLRDYFDLPGMNVLQFCFLDKILEDDDEYLKYNKVSYIGTHDNDTLRSYIKCLSVKDKKLYRDIFWYLNYNSDDIYENLIEYLFSMDCKTVILSLADLLNLGSEARINTPGVMGDCNWTWRLCNYNKFKKNILRLRKLIICNNRSEEKII